MEHAGPAFGSQQLPLWPFVLPGMHFHMASRCLVFGTYLQMPVYVFAHTGTHWHKTRQACEVSHLFTAVGPCSG